MPNGRPGDSRSHDILHHRLPVYGPAIDALIREIDAVIDPAARPAFIELIETWPFEPAGEPSDPEGLFRRLSALRGRLGPSPSPRPEAPEAMTPPPPPRRPGSVGAAIIGLGIGGLVGLPLGGLGYLVARAAALPAAFWDSDRAMWGIIGGVAALCAAIGMLQGGHPTRPGHALLIAVLALFLGSLGVGVAAAIVALIAAALGAVPPRAGSFGMVPLAGAAGGVLLAVWAGRKAWREWRG
jgi:hypothetical protein